MGDSLSGLTLWTLSYPIIFVLTVLAATAVLLYAGAWVTGRALRGRRDLGEKRPGPHDPHFYVLRGRIYLTDDTGAATPVGQASDFRLSHWIHGRRYGA